MKSVYVIGYSDASQDAVDRLSHQCYLQTGHSWEMLFEYYQTLYCEESKYEVVYRL